jgi:hypothetical protein
MAAATARAGAAFFECSLSSERSAMTQFRFLAALAIGSLAIAATALAAPPYPPSSAQNRAEATCRAQNVSPQSVSWELCLSHVTRAYEWGEPALAKQLAKAAGNAPVSCLDEGYDAASSGFRACVDREVDARSQLMILGDDKSGENVAQAQ